MARTIDDEEATRHAGNAALMAALKHDGLGDGQSSWDLDVINDVERGRFMAALGAEAIGELTYRLVGDRVVLLSTWVDVAYRNHRVATELIARALQEVRGSGKTITVICPVIGEFIARNPEHGDLIDTTRPGSGAYHERAPKEGALR